MYDSLKDAFSPMYFSGDNAMLTQAGPPTPNFNSGGGGSGGDGCGCLAVVIIVLIAGCVYLAFRLF